MWFHEFSRSYAKVNIRCMHVVLVKENHFEVQIKFSSLSAPTKIEELTAGSDEKTIFVGAEREKNLIGMIPTRASLSFRSSFFI